MSAVEDFEEFVESHGLPEQAELPSAEDAAALTQMLPAVLADFLTEVGFGDYFDGLFRLRDPRPLQAVLPLIFKADGDLDHSDCHVVAHTAFGMLRLWSRRHGIVEIDLPAGMVFCQALAPTQFRDLTSAPVVAANDERMTSGLLPYEADDVDYSDWQGEPMFERCRDLHGPLARDECYGFVPALAIAGLDSPARSVKNIKRVKALEHFAILAQLGSFHLTKIGRSSFESVRAIG